jgi:predicted lipoprotein with Yx(FWY)xxD motif
MLRRMLTAIALLGLILVPASATAAQDMGMGLFSVTDHPTLGQILADAAGMTLYTWAGDSPGASSCNDACATAWPPYLVDGNMMDMMDMMDPSMRVGTIERDDGTYQLAIDGWPLYYFQRDTAPGDANGEGSNGFGARWSVITTDAMMGM